MLLVSEAQVDEAVRELVRIGLDDVVAWAPPEEIETCGARLESIETIDFEAVDLLLNSSDADRFLLVDVRRRSEYEAAGASEALQIAHTRLAERRGEVPKDRELLVYCAAGGRAAVAAAFLAGHGHLVHFVDDAVAPWLARRSG